MWWSGAKASYGKNFDYGNVLVVSDLLTVQKRKSEFCLVGGIRLESVSSLQRGGLAAEL